MKSSKLKMIYALITILFIFIIVELNINSGIEDIKNNKKILKNINSELNERYFMKIERLLDKLSNNKNIFNKNVGENIFEILKENLDLGIIYILDKDGNVFISTTKGMYGKNYKFRDYYKKIILDGKDKYIDYAVGNVTKKRGMYFSKLIVNNKDKFVLVIKLNLKKVDSFLKKYKENINLILSDGVIIASNREENILKTTGKNMKKDYKKYNGINIISIKNKLDKKYNMILYKNHTNDKIVMFEEKNIINLKEKDYKIILIIFIIMFLFIIIIYFILKKLNEIEEIKENLKKYLWVIEQNPLSIILTDKEFNIEYVNVEYLKRYKIYKPIVGEKFELKEDWNEIHKFLKSDNVWQDERRNTKNGNWEKLIMSTLRDENGEIVNHVITEEDITERKLLEEKLKKLATIDEMTKTYNRRAGLEILDRKILMANREHIGISVIYVDVDNLKSTNDIYSHKEGDNLILTVVKIMKESIREEDIITRLGGDEFLIVLIDCKLEDINLVLNRMEEKRKIYNNNSNKEYEISFSCGTANYNKKRHKNSMKLINEADSKMYIEKSKHKNCEE
ncbi:sensor domain-containing diguanylate cyclase [Haliovirga abyssi]|uniref:Diguanylate cyclase n=1 Tax=Haliovirga abyssi TaxID=2996794 RepID=A0AAU9D1Y5_9FUSO|nr:GGDEF domain-containing protein [Haliovirga abyssi]BDU49999.1 hypothetical protein HLVA_05680 [Haliovirga abyssi]